MRTDGGQVNYEGNFIFVILFDNEKLRTNQGWVGIGLIITTVATTQGFEISEKMTGKSLEFFVSVECP